VNTRKNSQQNGSGKLNVIFHGAFTFDESKEPDRILALMPRMGHHVYRAGSWLAETEVRGRTTSEEVVYELLGVKPGTENFKPEQNRNVMVKPQGQSDPEKAPYATLKFPLPNKITSLRVAEIPRRDFTFPEELVVDSDPQHIATLQVFTYDIEDQNTLSLKAQDGDGHYWEPVFTGNYINLHIFSAEDHYHKPSNAKEDFNECAKLVGGVKLRLQTRSLRASGIVDAGQLPAGVVEEETEDLALRTMRMDRLGRLIRQNGDANLAWYGNDAMDGSPRACGPIVVKPPVHEERRPLRKRQHREVMT
jgi:hypothetical protein